MSMNTTMGRGLTAAVIAALLAAVATVAFLGVASAQSVTGLIIGSGEAEPEAELEIEVEAKADGLGAYTLDILYDSTKVEAKACTSTDGACTIDQIGPGIVRIEGTNVAGVTGDAAVLGAITFKCGPNEGTSSLTLDSSSLVLEDIQGGALVLSGDAVTAGTINCVAVAAATAAPTAAPAAVPSTGGAPGSSSSNSMAWLLAAGLVFMLAGGGAWVLARGGRER